MTSSATSVLWRQALIAHPAVVAPEAAPRTGRHAAPDVPGRLEIMAAEEARPGRHAEPEWSRAAFDPQRDEDPFEWLGFTA